MRELVPSDHDKIQRDAEVARDERLDRECADKRVVGLEERDEAAEEKGNVRAPCLRGRYVRHVFVADTLRRPCATEVNVSDEDGDPGEETKDGDQVREIREDLRE